MAGEETPDDEGATSRSFEFLPCYEKQIWRMVGTSCVYRREYTPATAQFWVRLRPKTCWRTTEPKVHHQTVKHPPSIMVWGGITAAGRCGLHIFDKEERVNAVKYISVLNSKVKLHMHISGATICQQDWAPCHTARTVQKWFVDNHI